MAKEERISKKFYSDRQAEQYEQELYEIYHSVKLVDCPIFGCSHKGSIYTWLVSK